MPSTPCRRFFLHFFCVFTLFALFNAAQANDSLYEVRRISVDETAKTEVAAKEKGLAVAKRRGLQRLLEILTLRQDRGKLPKISDQQLEQMVYGLSVADEKMSRGQGRYLASITIKYRPDLIRALLQQNAIPFVETQSKRLLILPVMRHAGTALLWEEGNAWFQAWARERLKGDLVPVALPWGDLGDVSVINVREALAGDQEKLMAIAGKYNADGVVLTVASLEKAPLSSDQGIRIETRVMAPGWDGVNFKSDYRSQEGQTLEQILAVASRNTLSELVESWKRGNLVDHSAGRRNLVVTVNVSGLQEWVSIRKKLEQQSTIDRYSLESLSVKEAVVSMDYIGTTEQLRTALAQNDLRLDYDLAKQYWVLTVNR
ncbi:DUF2066 domain-containing protein [Aestuariispira insulae]|uniref:Uncharacterized protein DUF2066 n=1 Tax=Aestuariispira insulae TaxID=1461337 RepID=A0A3D9HPP7_9PROT|nr:DUF2066 domain-containing protein [Aestuariispira insulae]RED50876.1 uncharacterized protein DUF2066 [Aestuariispira insulae]